MRSNYMVLYKLLQRRCDYKKTNFKKMIAVCVMFIMLLLTFSFVGYADEATPFYNNVSTTNSSVTISNSGVLTIVNKYSGSSSVTTKAVITTYVEKKVLGIFWSRVDIGQTNDEWVDTIYNHTYSGSHSVQLSSASTYRVNVEYVIYGLGGSADTITKEIQKLYS